MISFASPVRKGLVTSLFVLFVALVFIRETSWVINLDQHIYEQAMQFSVSRAWLIFWQAVTILGNGTSVYILCAILAFVYLFQGISKQRFLLILFWTSLFLINPLLKILFALDRPVGLSPFYPELTTFTFPSGHSFNAAILAFFIPRLILAVSQNKKGLVVWVIQSQIFPLIQCACVLLIPLSRVFLGVHWFSDVVTGAVLGSLAALVSVEFLERVS
ncbi:MAG: phosphatase PAP2 family protein [Deltaproteobacteria bacterium]|nr:phosphatase PAP2 family protein [Deltaproteobacteria bacterium]